MPRNGSPALFDLVQPLAETATTRAVMRAYRDNPLSSFPARAYEDDRIVRPFFGRPSILTNRAEDIRHVLIDNADNYGRTRAGIRILRSLLGDGLVLATGTAWRAQRRTIAAAFVPGAVPAFAAATAEALIPALGDIGERGGAPVDLLDWLQTLTLDVAGRALFSLPLNDGLGRAMRDAIGGYGLRYGRPSFLDMALPLWFPNPRDLGRRLVQRRLLAMIDRLIAARRQLADAGRRGDLFDLLTAAEATASSGMARLRDQVATLIVAGHETTAIALFWALRLVVSHPEWQARVAAEAIAHDLSPAGAGRALPALALSRAVVDEAMRLFPPASIIARQAIGADQLDDLAVDPGTIILISPWVLHRHRRLWREPDAFAPERFLTEKASIKRFSYLPFGAGPRTCVGGSLAVTEATIVLSTLLKAFCIEAADHAPVLPVGAITIRPSRSVLYRLIPRG